MNIIFDIGNVLLKWSPNDIINIAFENELDKVHFREKIFSKESYWIDYNKGRYNENELIDLYHQNFLIKKESLQYLMNVIKDSLTPIPGSLELLDNLYKQNIPLYSITDNVREIIDYLYKKYDFWYKFKDVITSYQVGSLKNEEKIFLHFLDKHHLSASDCIFIDDHKPNIEVARKLSFNVILFTTINDCIKKLQENFNINI